MTWDKALRETMALYLNEDNRWGDTDCCQFVREYHRRLTGQDLGLEFDYESQQGAMRIFAKHGGLGPFLSTLLGDKPEMEPGDIVMISDACPGVLTDYCVVFMDEKGLARVTKDKAEPICQQQ